MTSVDTTNFDVDTFLRLENNAFSQDREAERILSLETKSQNPLEILELDTPTWLLGKLEEKQIKFSYRKKSLLLHPDKCKHVRAQDAFEMLKKAESELMEEGKRAWLLGLVAEARVAVYKRRGLLKLNATSEKGVVLPDSTTKEFAVIVAAIKVETRRLLQDQASRDTLRLKNEVERKNEEDEKKLTERKRKVDHDKKWEEGREERIGDWRKFVKKSDAIKKKKLKKGSGPELLG
ncbi:hypothetical protein HDU98_005006 [Podochytrium sp. JEL0797]|nr:hypothetical protein HDU98_005006 [Podochytrium sp. JEL0797]